MKDTNVWHKFGLGFLTSQFHSVSDLEKKMFCLNLYYFLNEWNPQIFNLGGGIGQEKCLIFRICIALIHLIFGSYGAFV